MRKAILGAASALALASPAVAADLQVTPYSENPGYEQEVPPYAYGTAPPYAYGVRGHTRHTRMGLRRLSL